uniref:Uncharacterized protein n=1 Tax=Globodera rostochiensis TaxID=31243 RepID=A0A914I7T1_GLORO
MKIGFAVVVVVLLLLLPYQCNSLHCKQGIEDAEKQDATYCSRGKKDPEWTKCGAAVCERDGTYKIVWDCFAEKMTVEECAIAAPGHIEYLEAQMNIPKQDSVWSSCKCNFGNEGEKIDLDALLGLTLRSALTIVASIEKGGVVMSLCNFTFTFLLLLGGMLVCWMMRSRFEMFWAFCLLICVCVAEAGNFQNPSVEPTIGASVLPLLGGLGILAVIAIVAIGGWAVILWRKKHTGSYSLSANAAAGGGSNTVSDQ